MNERCATIVFDETGTKTFPTGVAQLEHSSTPAPAKPARSKHALQFGLLEEAHAPVLS